MSWPLASFAIVLGLLVAGWWVYERSRPSARMAAVVGTLAAIAALGRDAFVALPDVKPITAMTFVVGYALGPLPGFTVGAMGMLASNILLGQGPYTPWQMVAWGLVGLAGAAFGRITKRSASRLGLALGCAVMALVAKEIMNVYTWTIGAVHTPAALLGWVGAALPFDVTDTVASFFFGLAFGPELARLLGRIRARMTVTWEAVPDARLMALIALLACSAATIALRPGMARARPGMARASGAAVLARGVAYLESAQNRDGGFGAAAGERSSELYSAWAAIGLAGAGRDPLSLRRGGHTVLDAIEAQASSLQGAGDLERTILALHACGVAADKLGSRDLVAQLLRYRAADGSFSQLVNLTAFAILALRAAGRYAHDPVVRAAALWLARQQNPDGGFGYAGRTPNGHVGAGSDVDDTAAALQGVVAASVPAGPVVSGASSFLKRAQNSDGGYPQQPGGESNAQSTAWAVQGLVAAGHDPARVARDGRSPLTYLAGLVASNGSVRYAAGNEQTPVWVTGEALAALASKALPIGPPASSGEHVVRSISSSATTTSTPSARHAEVSAGVLKAPATVFTSARLEAFSHMLARLLSGLPTRIGW